MLKEAWVENGLRVLKRPAFYPPLLAPLPLLNEGCSEVEGGGMTKEEWKFYRRLSWTHNRALS